MKERSDLGNYLVMSDNIAYYMERDRMTRHELAKALGVSYSIVTQWLNAKAYPRIDSIERMANLFGIEKKDLIERREPELSEPVKQLIENAKKLTPEQAEAMLKVMQAFL